MMAEHAHSIAGVSGRMFRSTRPDRPGLFSTQKWLSEARPVSGYGCTSATMSVEIRFDDDCGNGHHTFAITADVTVPKSTRYGHASRESIASGCMHDEIAQAFPELAPLVRWHLCSTDGPMHYLANTVYLAGDRDHFGLRKGETRPLVSRDGLPRWELVAINSLGVALSGSPLGLAYQGAETVPLFILRTDATGAEVPYATPRLEWRPRMQIGEERDLDAARRAACWPEATDEELSQEPADLRAALEARLPALLAEFRAAVLAAGFVWVAP